MLYRQVIMRCQSIISKGLTNVSRQRVCTDRTPQTSHVSCASWEPLAYHLHQPLIPKKCHKALGVILSTKVRDTQNACIRFNNIFWQYASALPSLPPASQTSPCQAFNIILAFANKPGIEDMEYL